MHNIFDHDGFQERRKFLLDLYEEYNVPHIRTTVFNDNFGAQGIEGDDPKDSPIVELAGLFEFLVNVLIGEVLLGTDDTSIILLDHLKNDLGNQIFLMGSLIENGLGTSERWSTDDLNRWKRKKDAEGKEADTTIPIVFTEALEHIQKNRKIRED